jgi:UDP-glucuronate 4-epimerase
MIGHYLLTGAAGFIASRVATLLLAQGHIVVGIDNLNDAYDKRLKDWRLNQLMLCPGFQFHRLDVCDRSGLQSLWQQLGPFDAVINLAARAGVRQSVGNPWIYFDTNTTGTLNLLDLCQQYKVKKFILASTSSLYGTHNPMPYCEDADTSQPLSPYAASKRGAEAIAHSYHYLYGTDVTIFRYFTVYGPAGRPDMSLFRFVQWISEDHPVTVFGDGKQSRDFTYVDDIARGTVAGLGLSAGYQIINLGSDSPQDLIDIIRLIENIVGKKAIIDYRPRHPADVTATWADITRARQLLNWEPQTTIEQGVQNLVDWYQVNRSWAKDIKTG